MKKYFLPFVFLFMSIKAFAQDNNRASVIGSEIGKVVGFVIVAALFVWGISRLAKKMK